MLMTLLRQRLSGASRSTDEPTLTDAVVSTIPAHDPTTCTAYDCTPCRAERFHNSTAWGR